MQAEQDSEYDDSEVEELKLKLIKYVIEKLNPMIAQLNLIKEDKKKPQLMDWKKDAKILIPAINKVAHEDIREKEYLHWWTFMGLFMEIGESLFSTITNIREKVSKGKKLDSWEKEFYSSNKELVDLKATPERSEEEKEELRRVFGLANN